MTGSSSGSSAGAAGSVPPAGAHGGDAASVAAALGIAAHALLDLSQNLNPLAADPAPVLERHLAAVRSYPDVAIAHRAASAALEVDPDSLLLTAGGASAIALVADHLKRGSIVEPEFAAYRRHLVVDAAAGRWRSNPNNPTGALADPDSVAAVWDEAFYPLATGTWTRGDVADGSIVVGSFTKLLACPGLRTGYVHAAPSVIRVLTARQPEWAVDGLVCAALPELLATVDLPAWTAAIAERRARLAALLVAVGLTPAPSSAPWLLVDVGDAATFRASLAPLGVLVRDCTSFSLPAHVRVAVPDDEGLDRVAEALHRWSDAR